MKSTLLLFVFLPAFEIAFTQQPKVWVMKVGEEKPKPKFSFIHITDTHIGEGTPGGDYGTHGFFDTLNGNERGYPAARLSNSMQWINVNTFQNRIAFVIVSGDLTDSGEKSEFLHFKKIMDSLAIPYFPLMGNHDAWPYNRFGDEAATACGDSLMNEVFDNTFKTLDEYFVLRSSTRKTRWWNEASQSYSYLQNFHYSHQGYSFIFLDFNPRYHVRKDEPGIGPQASLMPGEGGTLEFLKSALQKADSLNEKIFLISHHPPIASIVGFHYAFTAKAKLSLAKVLKPYRKNIEGWFAGHIHRHANYGFTKAKGLKVFETKANKSQEFGGFRLVKVY